MTRQYLKMSFSYTEENYLKAIYSLSAANKEFATSTNEIAEKICNKPSTVTDMLRKLTDKKLIHYQKYRPVKLTKEGKTIALQVIRKHRLWEVFLNQELKFSWDELHEVAEQLEHIQSEKLTSALDKYLGFPEHDPHGDPIPKANGEIKDVPKILLCEVKTGRQYRIAGVKDSSTLFLQYLEKLSITIGTKIKVLEKIDFDESLVIQIGKVKKTTISKKFSQSILVDF